MTKDYQIGHQIIDNDEEFQPCMTEYLKNTSFWNNACDYAVVSIFGAQSSGKSTLLNRLFGTKFQVMDSTVGFHQCTQGIFMSSNDELGNLVVMDVEGTDSMERQKSGEEGQAFEKRISLFALAVSDVLIINIMERDINRAQGSNYMLLQLLFELNLQIFHKDRLDSSGEAAKTLLYFVIRDSGDIEQQKSIDIIRKHMDRMWKDLFKENPKESINFDSCFDITYSFLPHKTHKPKEWEEKVIAMKPRFHNKSKECVLKDEYSRKIPISGLQEYCKNTWNIIKQNKDIDLPAQREMMARYRCGEISTQIKLDFKDALQKLRVSFIDGDEPGVLFGSTANTTKKKLIAQYNELTAYYIEKIRVEFEEKLEGDIDFALKQLYGDVCKKIRDATLQTMKEELATKTTEEKPIWTNCYVELQTMNEDMVNTFKEAAEKARGDFTQWKYQFHVDDLIDSYHVLQERIIETQVQLRIRETIELQQSQLQNTLSTTISKKNVVDEEQSLEEFDESIRDAYVMSIENTLSKINDIHDEFHIEDPPSFKDRLAEAARSVVVASFSNHANYLSNLMVKSFKESFPPLLPTKTEQIERAFIKSRDRAMFLLNQFFYVPIGKSRPSLTFHFDSKKPSLQYPSNLDDQFVVLSKDQCVSIFKDFMAEVVVLRLQAEHENERKNATAMNVPWYLWFFLLILGWNELMWVIKNPFYLFLAILVVIFIFGVRIRKMVNDHYVAMPWWLRVGLMQVNNVMPASYRMLDDDTIPDKEKEKHQ